MKPRHRGTRPVERRALAAKVASLRLAVDALCRKNLAAVHHVTAAADVKGNWQLLVSTGASRPFPSICADRYAIHYLPRKSCLPSFEAARIRRFLDMLARHGCRPRRIVTGTRTGPDMMIRLADGSPAIVEISCNRSPHQLRELLAERYDYLLDTFKLFYATEYRSGSWYIWRVKRSGCEKVSPEALNG